MFGVSGADVYAGCARLLMRLYLAEGLIKSEVVHKELEESVCLEEYCEGNARLMCNFRTLESSCAY